MLTIKQKFFMFCQDTAKRINQPLRRAISFKSRSFSEWYLLVLSKTKELFYFVKKKSKSLTKPYSSLNALIGVIQTTDFRKGSLKPNPEFKIAVK